MTPNIGATRNYLSGEELNRIQNGGYLSPISLNCGVDIYGGKDYSYTQFGGSFNRSFRKVFQILDYALFDALDIWDDIFKIGELDRGRGGATRPVFFFYGVRVVVEYFDRNAILDFVSKIDESASIPHALEKCVDIYGRKYAVKILNEHLINIESL